LHCFRPAVDAVEERNADGREQVGNAPLRVPAQANRARAGALST